MNQDKLENTVRDLVIEQAKFASQMATIELYIKRLASKLENKQNVDTFFKNES